MIRQAAIDLLNNGGVSVPMLGGAIISRRLLSPELPAGMAYVKAREVLDALAAEGLAQKWNSGDCYTLPKSTTFEKPKEPK